MAKIIVTLGDTVLQEIVISKERITIGRRPHNDIVIDDIAVSGEHATIVTILNDSLLEDLNSTNGTQVNGQPVKKHFLQNHDVIELANYSIQYITDEFGDAMDSDSSKILASRGPISGLRPARESAYGNVKKAPQFSTVASQHTAAIRVLNGASAGKEIGLTKALTTIGRPGVQVAVIAQRPQGYCLTHVEGDAYPVVNGQSIGARAHSMMHGDVIDLLGTQMAFLMA